MSISQNSILISGAVAYPVNNSTLGVISNILPPEGEKCVPMQFTFQETAIWFVDLSIALTSNKFSQLRSMYIDATQSSHDVIVYFPDTGFEAVCRAGYSNLISLINVRYGYKFYVSLVGQVNDPISVINLIPTNVMLPPFNTFNLFTPPQQTFLAQCNNNTLAVGKNQGLELGGFKAIESNLAVMLTGAVSGQLYSVKIDIATANYPSGTENQILASHTLTATKNFIVNDSFAVPCTNDYFFFRDVLNTNVPNELFFFPLNLYVTLLTGIDGGAVSHETYSCLNWTYAGISD